jgi:hypothetical protein
LISIPDNASRFKLLKSSGCREIELGLADGNGVSEGGALNKREEEDEIETANDHEA